MTQNLSTEKSLGFTLFYDALAGLCARPAVILLILSGADSAPLGRNGAVPRATESGAAAPFFSVAFRAGAKLCHR
jgi:hypothetical protein